MTLICTLAVTLVAVPLFACFIAAVWRADRSSTR